MIRGISTNRSIAAIASCLSAENVAFVCRYYSATTKQPEKRLTSDEAKQLISFGIKIVTVYEDGPTSFAYFSEIRGQKDGANAHAYARKIGQPPDSAIYFAVDYDASDSDTSGAITTYFQALKNSLASAAGKETPYKIGVYGSGRVCNHIKEKLGIATYSWLAESHGWAGHSAYTKPDIRQEISSASLCDLKGGVGGNYEDNFSTGDFGAFPSNHAGIPEKPSDAQGILTNSALSQYADAVSKLALDQYDSYHQYPETQDPLSNQIQRYWDYLGFGFPGVQTPWSAVFISWIMRTAGASIGEFKTSSAHSRFVYWAIKNKKNKTGLFHGYPLNEYPPDVGDIIQNNRGGQNLTFTFAEAHEAYESHSAIVVERGSDSHGEFAITIGGNEGDSIGKRRIALDGNGYIIQRAINPYICVIRNLK